MSKSNKHFTASHETPKIKNIHVGGCSLLFIEMHYKEVTFLQNHSKATLVIVLALVFIVAMTNAAIADSSMYAILPAKQTILEKGGGKERGAQNRFGRQRKPTTRKYYRLQSYHRKMLYR